MRINSLYISSFAGIKNLKLDFCDGLNIIYGNNENGKTTVMTFIKMMFYGSKNGGSSLSKNIRKKYTPWDNSAMAGSIDFEHNGKKYRLEKEFRASNSTDKATLYDLQLSEGKAVSSDVGTEFFGISLAAFERSVFIGQFGFPENDSDAEGEISAKLSNLALTGDENISFDAVNARLQKAKLALMSKSGRAGAYDKNIKAASEIQEKILFLSSQSKELAEKKDRITRLETEISALQKNAQELNSKISSEQDIRNAQKLTRLLELKGKLDKLNKTLTLSDGTVIDEMYLRKLKFCISKADTAKAKVSSKENEIALLNKSIKAGLNPPENATKENSKILGDEISELSQVINQKNADYEALKARLYALEQELPQSFKKRKKVNIPLLISGGIGLILFAVLILFNLILGIIGMGVGLIISVLSFILKPIDNKPSQKIQEEIRTVKSSLSDLETEKNTVSLKLANTSAKLDAINAALNATAAVLENQQKMLVTAKTELQELIAVQNSENEVLLKLFSLYKPLSSPAEISDLLDEITAKTENQTKIKTELSVYLNELGGISYENAREKLSEISNSESLQTEDFEFLKTEYSKIIDVISDKKSSVAALKAETKTLDSISKNIAELEKQLESLKLKIAEQKEFCDLIDLASVTLAESFAEIHSSYGAVLEHEAAEIFSHLTNGKYKDMYISKSFGIDVGQTDTFGRRDIAYLSSGAADQGYLSLRLAVSRLMSKNSEALPVLLDDSLAQYDDNRTKAALEFLKAYSSDQQVIMFTCHSFICECAKALECECINLV